MPSKKKQSRGSKKKGRRNKGGEGSAPAAKKDPVHDAEDEALVQRLLHLEDKSEENIEAQILVRQVQKGLHSYTMRAGGMAMGARRESDRERMLNAGLTGAVLKLLAQCADKGFDDALSEAGANRSDRLDSPLSWLEILGQIVTPQADERIRMEIAMGIGPLVQCLSDESSRVLFKSKQLWYESLVPSLKLIGLVTCQSTSALEIVLNHENNLLETAIQCIFWQSHRPDIAKEAKTYDSNLKKASALAHMFMLTVIGVGTEGGEDSEKVALLNQIGSTPIVSRVYDPTCTVSFVAGLLQLFRTEDRSSEFWDQAIRDRRLHAVKILVDAGCVDLHLIAEIVTFGSTCASDSADACLVVNVLQTALCPSTGPTDTPISAAVNAGLLEMCLQLVPCFDELGAIEKVLNLLLQCVNAVSTQKKTSKALIARRSQVLSALHSSTCGSDGMVQIIESIINNMSGTADSEGLSDCANCYKSLTKSEVRRCGQCKKATYCSVQCQREDWKTHKAVCKMVSSPQNKMPQSSKMRIHEQNLVEAGQKLIHENKIPILVRALLKGCDICDNVVVLDMSLAPPVIHVKTIEQYLAEEHEEFVKDKHPSSNPDTEATVRDALLRSKEQRLLSCVFIGGGLRGELTNTLCVVPEWSDKQKAVKKILGDNNLELVRKRPDLLERIVSEMHSQIDGKDLSPLKVIFH